MCACNKRERWIVTINGVKFVKASEKEARAFAAKHPNASVTIAKA